MLEGGSQSPVLNMSKDMCLEGSPYLKALGKVSHLEASSLIKLSEIDKELVGNTSVLILVPETVVALKTASHVVGIEESNLGRVNQSTSSEHLDICPRDKMDRRASEWCCGNGLDALSSWVGHSGVLGKERCQVLGHADGSEKEVRRERISTL